MAWSLVCKELGIKRKLSTAFHPETDGGTEHENAELEVYLRAFCTYNQSDWAKLLPMAQMAWMN